MSIVAFVGAAGSVFSSHADAASAVAALRARGPLAFTNGVFDLLHVGHLRTLVHARHMGESLVVGVNDDVSARGQRPPGRPVIAEHARAEVVAALRCVDAVILFHESTPEGIIRALRPDVLVKGGTYEVDDVVGGAFVRSYGGRVELAPVVGGVSTSALIQRILSTRP